MAGVNMTEVRLMSVPLRRDLAHTWYFVHPYYQTAYFETLARQMNKSYTDFSYQRKDNIIRIPDNYDNVMLANYVMYRNQNHSDKWYYAFITDMKYVNEGMTEITIETDVIQTWLFDYTVTNSFVEREHVKDDNIGANTVPEQLELGDYMCNLHTKAGYTKPYNMVIVLAVTKTPEGDNVTGNLYNNIYSGIQYLTFRNNSEGITALNEYIHSYAEDGAADSIVCMFLAPDKLATVREDNTIAHSNTVKTHYINHGFSSDINTDISITTNQLDGYDPKNNKLKTYPFRYLLASNNNGGGAVYKYEQFYEINNSGLIPKKVMLPPEFIIEGCLTPGGSVRMIPTNYNGEVRNDSESIPLGKYPILNWTSDVYTNWLTQNAVNIPLSIGSAVVTTGLAIAGAVLAPATGGLSAAATVGAISTGVSGITSITSTLGEIYQHSLQPPQAEGNLNSGDVVTATGDNDFHFYDMSIKKEYAEIIDGYFNMFGYQVNRVKIPEKAHRESYWYTKCIDANVWGDAPGDALDKIRECYNRGITFWRDGKIMYKYDQSNNII